MAASEFAVASRGSCELGAGVHSGEQSIKLQSMFERKGKSAAGPSNVRSAGVRTHKAHFEVCARLGLARASPPGKVTGPRGLSCGHTLATAILSMKAGSVADS